jgi:hypothetical protein
LRIISFYAGLGCYDVDKKVETTLLIHIQLRDMKQGIDQ